MKRNFAAETEFNGLYSRVSSLHDLDDEFLDSELRL